MKLKVYPDLPPWVDKLGGLLLIGLLLLPIILVFL